MSVHVLLRLLHSAHCSCTNSSSICCTRRVPRARTTVRQCTFALTCRRLIDARPVRTFIHSSTTKIDARTCTALRANSAHPFLIDAHRTAPHRAPHIERRRRARARTRSRTLPHASRTRWQVLPFRFCARRPRARTRTYVGRCAHAAAAAGAPGSARTPPRTPLQHLAVWQRNQNGSARSTLSVSWFVRAS